MNTNNFKRTFKNGTKLEYSRGSFDLWCVYKTKDGERRPLLDTDYFQQLSNFTIKYGTEKVYNDFVRIYNVTKKELTTEAIVTMEIVSSKYEEKEEMLELLTILYMTMVAEENKKNTKLGKRIKRLGIYTYLIEKKSLEYAVNFMKGMNWREIDYLCRKRGF